MGMEQAGDGNGSGKGLTSYYCDCWTNFTKQVGKNSSMAKSFKQRGGLSLIKCFYTSRIFCLEERSISYLSITPSF